MSSTHATAAGFMLKLAAALADPSEGRQRQRPAVGLASALALRVATTAELRRARGGGGSAGGGHSAAAERA